MNDIFYDNFIGIIKYLCVLIEFEFYKFKFFGYMFSFWVLENIEGIFFFYFVSVGNENNVLYEIEFGIMRKEYNILIKFGLCVVWVCVLWVFE